MYFDISLLLLLVFFYIFFLPISLLITNKTVVVVVDYVFFRLWQDYKNFIYFISNTVSMYFFISFYFSNLITGCVQFCLLLFVWLCVWVAVVLAFVVPLCNKTFVNDVVFNPIYYGNHHMHRNIAKFSSFFRYTNKRNDRKIRVYKFFSSQFFFLFISMSI